MPWEALSTATARTRLEMYLQWQVTPTLTTGEVDELFAMAKRADAYGIAPDAYADWKASTALTLGAERVPTTRNGYVYAVSTGGTTGSSEPDWPTTLDATVNDGTAVWTCSARAGWTPTFDLHAAAAEGWQMKAAKAVPSYDVKAGSVDAKRNQTYQACVRNAQLHRRKAGLGGVGSILTRATPQVSG